ncbi:phosphonate ABC transporter ATP-binding protein [Desulfoluna spongiiphila]|uniref:Phosphonate transport system ATP-binding protein n=1 Tax=Desulfoluna spongiiphila TaxID=419481 RepID=A0A1G5DXX5_9BACT|nr:phosphonate ABC transporter ATP-binding protein [Desulfoluna spongiiphila]SCY19370.1 phosphonate transport system ATP-binding protein [Desulfoluna spongiiphila]
MSDIIRPLDAAPGTTVLETRNLGKVYPNGTRALSGVSLAVRHDDFIVIIGSSGAGKSTFLRCLNRLVTPSCGEIRLDGEEITRATGRELRRVRQQVGMIFQQFNLVRRLTVLENVLVGRLRFCATPLTYTGSLLRYFSEAERELAFSLLKQVGIENLAYQRADSLSGGQQQRVAIARTLAQHPALFLADEPIASLDPKSSEIIMGLLRRIHEERGIPVVVNLHHIDFAKRYAKRIIGISGGGVVFDGPPGELTDEIIEGIYGPHADEPSLAACA